MQSTSDLKNLINTKTLNLVLLTLASGGLYATFWLYRHTRNIEAVTKQSVAGDAYLNWLIACTGLTPLLLRVADSSHDGGVAIVGLMFQMASIVLYVVWAFQARSALQNYALSVHRIDLRMNALYTLLLGAFYINHCIDDLPECERRQRILSGASDPQAERQP